MSKPFITDLAASGLMAFLLALSGCAPWPVVVASLDPGNNFGPSDNRAVVIGRIVQVEDGKEQNMRSPNWILTPPQVNMYRVESRQLFASAPVADKDGNFYWLLPRGTYLIAGYKYQNRLPIAPRTAFQVPPGPGVVYIGTLRIEIHTRHGFLFLGRSQKGPERIAVLDEFEQARAAFETRNPQAAQQVAKHLMVHSDLLPAFGPNWQSLIRMLNELGLPILTTAH